MSLWCLHLVAKRVSCCTMGGITAPLSTVEPAKRGSTGSELLPTLNVCKDRIKSTRSFLRSCCPADKSSLLDISWTRIPTFVFLWECEWNYRVSSPYCSSVRLCGGIQPVYVGRLQAELNGITPELRQSKQPPSALTRRLPLFSQLVVVRPVTDCCLWFHFMQPSSSSL